MIVLPILALAPCLILPADAERITAGDLAAASPAFANLAADTVLGFAPAPGVMRRWSAAELRRLAGRLGASPLPTEEICVERPVAALDPARLTAALQAALPEAEIRILDFSRQAVPEGILEFPRSGLRRSGGGTVWNGFVRYGGGRRFAVWAKVEVRAHQPVVVAAVDLRPGQPVAADQIRLEQRAGFPASGYVETIESVVGLEPRRTIRAGSPVPTTALASPPQVRPGDTVRVTVESGATRLELDAQAEGAAAAGQRVALRNPVSHRLFFAQVEGKGRASARQGKP